MIDRLREQLRIRQERIEQLERGNQSVPNVYEHRLSELETICRDQGRQLEHLNEKLRKSEIQADVKHDEESFSNFIFSDFDLD